MWGSSKVQAGVGASAMTLRYKLSLLRTYLSDVRYVPFFLQRRFRSITWRERIGRWVAKGRPQFDTLNGCDLQAFANLQQRGIAHLGELLNSSQVADIREYFDELPVSDPYRPQSKPFLAHDVKLCEHTHVGYYNTAEVLAAPHLLALANRPDILELVGAYLGCKPTIGYLAAWWSFAADGTAQAAENFHRDVDDWRFIKLFVYLTDVGPDSGPHIYVVGSARDERLRKIRRYTDEEVRAAFSDDVILTNFGSAGSGFLEDTYGLHKGQPVRVGRRLIFQAVYSIVSLPYAPKSPVCSLTEARKRTGLALDPYVNRLYLADGARL
jgi:hypothetical protein